MRREDIGCAARSIYQEIARFRFDYPLVVVSEAGPKESLHYYLYLVRPTPPSQSFMRRDANGVVQEWGRTTGQVYRPASIAMNGLAKLNRFMRDGNQSCLDDFWRQVGWLEQHAVIRADGAVVWPHDFDLKEGAVLLKSPWISAHVQGFVISALVRAWRISRRLRLLDLAKGAARVFELTWEHNGVKVESEGHQVYTETPGLPAPGIMDGFMRSLLGLYDLWVETNDPHIWELYEQGVDGLRYFLPRWDYKNKWSMYGNREYLCSPEYHCLNRQLLAVLAHLTKDVYLAEHALAWDPECLSAIDRVEIYIAHILTKNACRLRYRTWRQGASTVLSKRMPSPEMIVDAASSSPSTTESAV